MVFDASNTSAPRTIFVKRYKQTQMDEVRINRCIVKVDVVAAELSDLIEELKYKNSKSKSQKVDDDLGLRGKCLLDRLELRGDLRVDLTECSNLLE